MCLINPIVGALNSWISNVLMGMSSGSSVVLGLILGAMMATDMGGPLNKAAYVFGTAALANQNEIGYMIMAAVMVGGMVPPIAIAISTMVSKKKYTEAERKTGPANIVMGLSFITEGAIPFAAADPLHFTDGRLRNRRRTLDGIQVHTHGTSRRNLRIPCSW